MSFFDASSFQEQRLSMDHFREWAGAIAGAYMNSGVPPTDSLCKIARDEELTPHQIEVLAGESNKIIHQTKYASAKDKYLAADFPHADSKIALERLQLVGETKIAAVMPDPDVSMPEPDVFAAFGVEADSLEKSAAEASEKNLKHELKTAQVRVQVLREKIADAVYLEKCAAEAAERQFIKQARQMVLNGAHDSAGRMQVLGTIDHFVKCAEMTYARQSIAKLAYILAKEGLLLPGHAKTALSYFMSKEADLKAPVELISPHLPAKVVNGNHPLYITLKTFKHHADRMLESARRSNTVDDRLHILGERIRAL